MQQAFLETSLDEIGPTNRRKAIPPNRSLVGRAIAIRRLRTRCQYDAAASALPAIIVDAHHQARNGDRHSLAHLVHLCFDASFVARALADSPTASIAADRAARSARLTGDPVLLAGAGFAQAHAALRHREAQRSLDIVNRYLRHLPTAGADLAALRGMLHLTGAAAAARTTTLGWPVAAAHLEAARRLLPSAEHDRDPFHVRFSQTNCQQWSLGVALAAGDIDTALAVARDIRIRSVTKPSRRSALHIDLARLCRLTSRTGTAVTMLMRAEYAAPQYARSRGSVHRLVEELQHSRLTSTSRREVLRLSRRLQPAAR